MQESLDQGPAAGRKRVKTQKPANSGHFSPLYLFTSFFPRISDIFQIVFSFSVIAIFFKRFNDVVFYIVFFFFFGTRTQADKSVLQSMADIFPPDAFSRPAVGQIVPCRYGGVLVIRVFAFPIFPFSFSSHSFLFFFFFPESPSIQDALFTNPPKRAERCPLAPFATKDLKQLVKHKKPRGCFLTGVNFLIK